MKKSLLTSGQSEFLSPKTLNGQSQSGGSHDLMNHPVILVDHMHPPCLKLVLHCVVSPHGRACRRGSRLRMCWGVSGEEDSRTYEEIIETVTIDIAGGQAVAEVCTNLERRVITIRL